MEEEKSPNPFFMRRFCLKKGIEIEHEWQVFNFIHPELQGVKALYVNRAWRNYLFNLVRDNETKELRFSEIQNQSDSDTDAPIESRCGRMERIDFENEIADVIYNKCRDYAITKYGHRSWDLFMTYTEEGNYRKIAASQGMKANSLFVLVRDIIGFARKSLGVTAPKKERKQEKAVSLHKLGYSNIEIAVKLNVEIETVRKYLNKEGYSGSSGQGYVRNGRWLGAQVRVATVLV